VVHRLHDLGDGLEGAGRVDAAQPPLQQLAQVVAGQVLEHLERHRLALRRLAGRVRQAAVEGVDAAADGAHAPAVEVHEDRVALVPGPELVLAGVVRVQAEDLDAQGRRGDPGGDANGLVHVGLPARAEQAGQPVALLRPRQGVGRAADEVDGGVRHEWSFAQGVPSSPSATLASRRFD
jgi:hypothetical protein